ncbi:MAG: hypothetical protein NVV74_19315 [Magnetospirillum sp.]|nr:hypothetical protein [Magnetospirillum sp.]
MKPARLASLRMAVLALVPLLLSGCGVPDIVAHSVKAYERSQTPSQPAAAGNTTPAAYQPAPAATQPAPEPEALPASVPARETVTAEPLK